MASKISRIDQMKEESAFDNHSILYYVQLLSFFKD